MQISGTVPDNSTHFWDALAPHLAVIEDNYLNRKSIRRMLPAIRPPILIVGAGQGLIVEELRKPGLACDGLDFSPMMVHYAKVRRGLDLIQADATTIPVPDATYETIVYATGVVDFTRDESKLRAILHEGKRVVTRSGEIFVAFYRLSPALEHFLGNVGTLKDHLLANRESLKTYLFRPAQMLAWTAQRASISKFQAAVLLCRLWSSCTTREKILTYRMQKMFRRMDNPRSIIDAAAEKVPYRNETEIRNLFQRLDIPVKQLQNLGSCHVTEI